MNCRLLVLLVGFAALRNLPAQTPDNLVVEGIPPFNTDLKREAGRYLEFRTAAFSGWHPKQRQMLVVTRFADAAQLHLVSHPGGARRQVTFLSEPVAGGSFDPSAGEFAVFLQDAGGGEFFQLYRFDFADGRVALLTDGKSRNSAPTWSNDGNWIAYTSTRRNGRDTDVYVMNPREPKSDRLVAQLTGGGWSVMDWSPADSKLLLGEYISINESRLHQCDVRTGGLEPLTASAGDKVAWSAGLFARDDHALFVITDKDSEFQRLGRLELATRKLTPLSAAIRGDVEHLDLSRDGRKLAFVSNESGVSKLDRKSVV